MYNVRDNPHDKWVKSLWLSMQNTDFLYIFKYKHLIEYYIINDIRIFNILIINFSIDPGSYNRIVLIITLIGIITYIILFVFIYNIFICTIIILVTYIIKTSMLKYTKIRIKFFSIIPVSLMLCHFICFFIYLFIALLPLFSTQLFTFFWLSILWIYILIKLIWNIIKFISIYKRIRHYENNKNNKNK